MNDVFVRYISPFAHLLKPILGRTHAYLHNLRFDTVLFAHASFHIELYTSLNIKENSWDFVNFVANN